MAALLASMASMLMGCGAVKLGYCSVKKAPRMPRSVVKPHGGKAAWSPEPGAPGSPGGGPAEGRWAGAGVRRLQVGQVDAVGVGDRDAADARAAKVKREQGDQSGPRAGEAKQIFHGMLLLEWDD